MNSQSDANPNLNTRVFPPIEEYQTIVLSPNQSKDIFPENRNTSFSNAISINTLDCKMSHLQLAEIAFVPKKGLFPIYPETLQFTFNHFRAASFPYLTAFDVDPVPISIKTHFAPYAFAEVVWNPGSTAATTPSTNTFFIVNSEQFSSIITNLADLLQGDFLSKNFHTKGRFSSGDVPTMFIPDSVSLTDWNYSFPIPITTTILGDPMTNTGGLLINGPDTSGPYNLQEFSTFINSDMDINFDYSACMPQHTFDNVSAQVLTPTLPISTCILLTVTHPNYGELARVEFKPVPYAGGCTFGERNKLQWRAPINYVLYPISTNPTVSSGVYSTKLPDSGDILPVVTLPSLRSRILTSSFLNGDVDFKIPRCVQRKGKPYCSNFAETKTLSKLVKLRAPPVLVPDPKNIIQVICQNTQLSFIVSGPSVHLLKVLFVGDEKYENLVLEDRKPFVIKIPYAELEWKETLEKSVYSLDIFLADGSGNEHAYLSDLAEEIDMYFSVRVRNAPSLTVD